MTQLKPATTVLMFTPRPDALLLQIRALATDSSLVFFGRHAQERMEERGISDSDVSRVLAKGEIKGVISPGNRQGEWKCKIVATVKGSREVGVVTILMLNSRLFIKTVEWEDL